MDILQAIRILRPGTAWVITEADYETLAQVEDGTPRVSVPSLEELQSILDSKAYIEERAAEYPSIGDQLDALWKGGQAETDMLAKIQAVKAKYPKP